MQSAQKENPCRCPLIETAVFLISAGQSILGVSAVRTLKVTRESAVTNISGSPSCRSR
jgi:hypothetical protein